MNTNKEVNKPDCSNHKKDIAGITDMKELAELIGDLHYESLTFLFDHLQIKFWHDSNKDFNKGRTKLGNELYEMCVAMRQACAHSNQAWEISKPFMSKPKSNE